jgi:hypothetical protein
MSEVEQSDSVLFFWCLVRNERSGAERSGAERSAPPLRIKYPSYILDEAACQKCPNPPACEWLRSFLHSCKVRKFSSSVSSSSDSPDASQSQFPRCLRRPRPWPLLLLIQIRGPAPYNFLSRSDLPNPCLLPLPWKSATAHGCSCSQSPRGQNQVVGLQIHHRLLVSRLTDADERLLDPVPAVEADLPLQVAAVPR